MRKKKTTKIFYIGKNIPKNDSARTPIKGEPNSYIDFYDKKTGCFHRRRKLNEKGLACQDLDMPDYVEKTRHVHDYSEQGLRSKGRKPSKKEQKIMNKASKKRRFWK